MTLFGPDGKPLAPSAHSQKKEFLVRLDSLVRGVADELHKKADPGDWYGCFECVALDSQFAGERMVLIFGRDDWDKAKLGTPAPDTKTYGPGWKFHLKEKFREPTPASAWLHRQEEAHRA